MQCLQITSNAQMKHLLSTEHPDTNEIQFTTSQRIWIFLEFTAPSTYIVRNLKCCLKKVGRSCPTMIIRKLEASDHNDQIGI
ncbi:unnamed protein product [Leptidea sinapis]|uniref:Uncharacterized protein n=1 Tax=Leptidea sinapis TaxID=189913 RepID=A0A5E4Q5F2_9NEOP|nr:unnamed protein product [Leptidea sinapis]